ncbi:unnamed protein product [marine sediment metagenome]|uniref:Uncharacterized protein n=1 Tax=marine sediment metagenome TaxID=412755 RepID=X1S464_9ZZZZ
MSEQIDTESKSSDEAVKMLLNKAYHLAELGRVWAISYRTYPGGIMLVVYDDKLSYEVDYLNPDHLAVVFAPQSREGYVDLCTASDIKGCQAWIFKYDSHHGRWSIEAWNKEIGNKAFAKLVLHFILDEFKKLPHPQTSRPAGPDLVHPFTQGKVVEAP